MSLKMRAAVFCLLIILLASVASAQSETPLFVGQANVIALDAGETQRYAYALVQPSYVTLQMFGDSAAPTLNLWRDGEAIERLQPPTGQTIFSTSLLLDPGSYAWEIGTADAAANVMFTITSEVSLMPLPLPVNLLVNDEVSTLDPAALYTFTLLNEPSYLYIDSQRPEQGVFARLTKTTALGTRDDEAAAITELPVGTRLRLPAGSDAYRLELLTDGTETAQPFTLCFVPVSLGYCGGASDGSASAGAAPSGSSAGANSDTSMPTPTPSLIQSGGIPLPTPTPSLDLSGGIPLPTPTPSLIQSGGIPLPTPTPSLIQSGGIPLPTPIEINSGSLPMPTPMPPDSRPLLPVESTSAPITLPSGGVFGR